MKYYRHEKRDIIGRVIYRETISEDELDKRHVIEEGEPLFNLVKERSTGTSQQRSNQYHSAMAILWILFTAFALAFAASSAFDRAVQTPQEQSK
jgi:hypothetical protein